MILHCNYEELRALRQGAHACLEEGGADERSSVAAPPVDMAEIEELLPRLHGDLTIETLEEQRTVTAVLRSIVECLRAEMDAAVLASHPGHETAVEAYFDYAHALSVLGRAEEMGDEMEALIEVVTGESATDGVAGSFLFPD